MKTLGVILASAFGAWVIINLIGAFIVGYIAKKLFPAKERIGWGMTLLVGFLGGILGKFLFWILHWPTGIVMGFVASIVGAFILLFAHHTMESKKAAKPAAG